MKKILLTLALLLPIIANAGQTLITLGEPDWPLDEPKATFNFDGVTAPALDIHANISDLDLLVSSTGNWRGALNAAVRGIYLPANQKVKSWMYTTSPPGAAPQITETDFSYGNIHFKQRPIVAIGPKRLMDRLCELGFTHCDAQPFLKDFGSVLVVPADNTSVTSIWDLAKPGVCYATSGELREAGSFSRYKRTLFAMAELERGTAAAQALVDTVYSKDRGGIIMHRDVPYSMINDGCASLLFYHIYKQADADLPGKFRAYPLGGATDFLSPAEGNIQGTQWRVMVEQNIDWTQYVLPQIKRAAEIHKNGHRFIMMLDSQAFTDIMPDFWVQRP